MDPKERSKEKNKGVSGKYIIKSRFSQRGRVGTMPTLQT